VDGAVGNAVAGKILALAYSGLFRENGDRCLSLFGIARAADYNIFIV
jgi:hypothetical protein